MNKTLKFFLLSLLILISVSGISILEISNFSLFTKFLNYAKTPSSWFIGLSLGYAFSNFFQKAVASIFLKIENSKKEVKPEGDFFEGFLITLLITSLIAPYLRTGILYFFDNLFIYIHVILLQCLVMIYLLFKLKNNYEISGKYILVSESIIFLNTIFILYFIA